MTSYTEGMPNLIMEASAAGIPVVSTRCGDSARLIHHGVTGFVVSPEDNLAMIAYLHQLLGDLEWRVRMGRAGREKMQREYGVASMVARISEIYERALSEKCIP